MLRNAAFILAILAPQLVTQLSAVADDSRPTQIRVATFNVSLNRRNASDLIKDLDSQDNAQAQRIAEIIQRVRPDVLLLNEFDFDQDGLAIRHFQRNYLAIAQGKGKPLTYRHSFSAPVNTGVQSGHDLDNNGRTGGPGDAFGFGFFPGQYGMCVLSQFPISLSEVRTFQKFLWRDMPDALLPETLDGSFYDDGELAIMRLSSKSHWDLPIQIHGTTLHLLCSHPTPPVFDGPEDRNGRRNHDEIRFWADYISEPRSGYIYDDRQQRGGLASGQHFVIAGDMNADPHDGDSTANAIAQLLSHPLVQSQHVPTSAGGQEKAKLDGGVNGKQRGDSSHDTSDFNDQNVGNLRLDYVLPSKSLKVIESGIFWPLQSEAAHDLIDASDHRLTWIDIEL